MQQILLFGKADKIFPLCDGFEIKGNGSIDFSLSGVNKLQIQEGKDINWMNLIDSQLHNLADQEEIIDLESCSGGYPFAFYDKYISSLWKKLETYCNPKSTAEKLFFNLYCELCCRDVHGGALLPALIPHVYVNWDFSQEERSKRKKPFIVDFIFKSSAFGTNDIVVVEIDGQSHYARYDTERKTYQLSEDVYAENLKKDRWLRKQGFKVFRIGNSELKTITSSPEKDKLDNFYCFFTEVFGKIVFY
ncbi:hypothetical protein [Tychonema sp. LEGE 07203]|uniref:hypothetical protein n=1 Tax=Tychonema sp. LEGE 07203 TaxID=1828671 RepID=UPI00187F82AE|nr:hypothetical protein [Tychonema sp. LEGE 07203]MBE9096894.1 hypothetical protein [Tychonema sp. LEGE 07203]